MSYCPRQVTTISCIRIYTYIQQKYLHAKSYIPSSIDDVNGEAERANVFAEKYSELYTSAQYDVLNMARLDASIDEMIVSKCATGLCDSDHVIITKDVNEGINYLNVTNYNK